MGYCQVGKFFREDNFQGVIARRLLFREDIVRVAIAQGAIVRAPFSISVHGRSKMFSACLRLNM